MNRLNLAKNWSVKEKKSVEIILSRIHEKSI